MIFWMLRSDWSPRMTSRRSAAEREKKKFSGDSGLRTEERSAAKFGGSGPPPGISPSKDCVHAGLCRPPAAPAFLSTPPPSAGLRLGDRSLSLSDFLREVRKMNFGASTGHVCMIQVLLLAVLCGLQCGAVEPPASQWSRKEHQNLTVRQHRNCVENEQYLHQGFCCLNCRAGTFVHKECERDQEQGVCHSCEHGQTYTEHSNGMNRCLPCTHCRTDEIETASCTTTSDTRCQCKPGTFCVPDQACEVCKRCAKCKAGEEEVKKCTPSSNTECRKHNLSPTKPSQASPTASPSSPSYTATVVSVIAVLLVLVLIGLAVWWYKQHPCEIPCIGSHSSDIKIRIDGNDPSAEERQNSQNAGLEGEEPRPESRPLLQETQHGVTKPSPPLEDEDRGLGDSLPNTTNSSQTSLSALPTLPSAVTPRQSPSAGRMTPVDVGDPLRYRLVPVKDAEKSLKMSFDLFEEHLDVRIHNKFFRAIGVSDNDIRIAQTDKVYELLKNWMQKQGLKADINDLLDVLLGMDQRRSAESIASDALRKGYYKHAETP